MKVEILETIKLGDGKVLGVGTLLDNEKGSIPQDIMAEIDRNTGRVRVLDAPAKPAPVPEPPPALVRRGKK